VPVTRHILAADVADVLLEPVRLRIENEEALVFPRRTEPLASQIQAQLERHVKAWERTAFIELDPRDVVNRVPRRCDQIEDLVQSKLARIESAPSAQRTKPPDDHGEHIRLKDRRIGFVERAVDEDAPFVVSRHSHCVTPSSPRSPQSTSRTPPSRRWPAASRSSRSGRGSHVRGGRGREKGPGL